LRKKSPPLRKRGQGGSRFAARGVVGSAEKTVGLDKYQKTDGSGKKRTIDPLLCTQKEKSRPAQKGSKGKKKKHGRETNWCLSSGRRGPALETLRLVSQKKEVWALNAVVEKKKRTRDDGLRGTWGKKTLDVNVVNLQAEGGARGQQAGSVWC